MRRPEPLIVDVDSFAAQNALEASYSFHSEEWSPRSTWDPRSRISTSRRASALLHQDIQLGGQTFIDSAQRKFNLSSTEAAAAVRGESNAGLEITPVVEQACEGLATAIERAQAYLRTAGEAGALSRILLCGGAALTPALPEFLGRRFGVSCEIANPLTRVNYDPGLFAGQDVMKVAPMLTVAIGLAMRRLGDKK